MPYKDTNKRKDYNKAYSQRYYQKNKPAIIARSRQSNIAKIERNNLFICEYLKDKACVLCGTDYGTVLTFDHLRDKFKEISEMVKSSYSIRAIEREIAKCRIICYNCHMEDEHRKRNTVKWRYFLPKRRPSSPVF